MTYELSVYTRSSPIDQVTGAWWPVTDPGFGRGGKKKSAAPSCAHSSAIPLLGPKIVLREVKDWSQ
jgi:hypothetical protein